MKLTEAEKARHPSIHYTGSVRGMKKLGYWGKNDRCVRCGQFIYNLSIAIGGYRRTWQHRQNRTPGINAKYFTATSAEIDIVAFIAGEKAFAGTLA